MTIACMIAAAWWTFTVALPVGVYLYRIGG